MLVNKKGWTAVQAKLKFADLVSEAKKKPQIITNHGKPIAVLVSIEEWQNKVKRTENLVDFLRNSPLYEQNLDLNRIKDECRKMEL